MASASLDPVLEHPQELGLLFAWQLHLHAFLRQPLDVAQDALADLAKLQQHLAVHDRLAIEALR